MIAHGMSSAILNFGSSSFHLVPLNLSLSYLIFKFFHLNYLAFNMVGLSFHFLNGFLTYLISFRIFKKRWLAIISGVLFLTSGVSGQLVMWPAVSISTLSLTLALLAWLVVLKEKSKHGFLDGLLAAILMILAFLTVEYSLGLLFFLPIVYLVIHNRQTLSERMRFIIPIFVLSFLYFLVRLLPLFIKGTDTAKIVDTSSSPILNKIFSMPFKYLTQTIIPEDILVWISHLFTKNAIKAETLVFDSLTISFGILLSIILIFLLYLLIKRKETNNLKIFISILFFLFISCAPYILLPGIAGQFSIFPPRYLYFGITGTALLITFVLNVNPFVPKNKVKITALAIISLMILVGIVENIKREQTLLEVGKTRESILVSIQKSYPKLPKKVVFYTESDSSYYYQQEKILPFQSGVGQTLLVWYFEENYDKSFYDDGFLWEINNQGYREAGDRGFGYFRDYQALSDTVKKYKIPLESVIAFSWHGDSKKLINITDQIRRKLEENGYE